MITIIGYLNHKNHFLEQFYALNEVELVAFKEGKFETLQSFYSLREDILAQIQYIDQQIEIESHREVELSPEDKKTLVEALAVKDEYVDRILSQDLEILACIESAKSSIIRELQELKKVRKAVGSYRSPQHDRRVDEEV